MRKIAILLLLLTFTSLSFAQTNFNQPIPNDPQVKIGKLKNGLTYYIRKNSKPEKKVEMRLAVNIGSILERDDQQGLAHFLEHMAFNGTEHFPKNELVSFLQSTGVRFGADLNAYTSFDETVYILSVPSEKKEILEKGLLVMKDWASALTLDPQEVQKERGVVLEELRLGRGANQRMRDKYFPKLFQGSQYANRLPIGKKDVLENFDIKSLRDFYEDWYRPDLMALVVVGDIDVNEIENKIKTEFSTIEAKRAKKTRTFFDVPDHKETLIAVETDKEAGFTSSQLIFKRPIEVQKTLADLKKNLVRQLFNSMINARFDEIRQSANPPFVFAFAGFGSLIRTKGSYSLFSQNDPKNAEAAITAMLLENRRVKEFGFTPAEFERQKESSLASLENRFKERNKTESYNFADNYVSNYLANTPASGIEFEYEFNKKVLPTIKLEEVNALAKDAISDENRVIIVTGTEKVDVKYPNTNELLATIKKADSLPITPYVETLATEPLVKELPTTAKITAENVDAKFGSTNLTLSNGVKIILKPTNFKEDEILMQAVSPGGVSLVDDKQAVSANSVSPFVNQAGVKNLSNIELKKVLAGKKATVTIGFGETLDVLNGNSTPKDFETMLQLIYLKFGAVRFDKTEFDSFIAREKVSAANLFNIPQLYFSNEVQKILNQNHPRAFGLPTIEQLDQVKLEEIEAIYKNRFADASDFTFIFVGNFETEKIKPLLTKYLGNLPSIKRVETGKDLGIRPPGGKIEKIISKGVDQQSVVQIIFTGETTFNSEDGRNLSSLGELLTVKLVEILREEKSGVYGVNAFGSLAKIPYPKYTVTISFPCGPENVDSLTKAVFDEIAKIQNGQIEDKDVAKVKEARFVKLKEDAKSNNFWLGGISRTIAQNVDFYTPEEVEARIKLITKESLQNTAKKYIDTNKRIQIVLMPEQKAMQKSATSSK
ncbi:MAG: insulinase family protein [Pyrinomonadaceae bacterium]|nr:insulinase family protein [Pyrinomonadaceae bacterium]